MTTAVQRRKEAQRQNLIADVAANSITYQVRGTGLFPFDMLRFDSAYPATEIDANRMRDTYRMRESIITVRSVKPPTTLRWLSFGWKVLTPNAGR